MSLQELANNALEASVQDRQSLSFAILICRLKNFKIQSHMKCNGNIVRKIIQQIYVLGTQQGEQLNIKQSLQRHLKYKLLSWTVITFVCKSLKNQVGSSPKEVSNYP